MTMSINRRLLQASMLAIPLFLIALGWLIDNAYYKASLQAAQQRFQAQIYMLLTVAEWQEDKLSMPPALPEPGFSQLQSGLMAFVSGNDKTLWQSASAQLTESQSLPSMLKREIVANQRHLSEHPKFLQYDFDVIWDIDDAQQPLRFTILLAREGFDAEITAFRTTLWPGLFMLGLLIIGGQLLIVRWGLAPLDRLAKDVQAIEKGEARQLANAYPDEIQPVADNVNLLNQNLRQQQDRFKHALSDLAHSLKTPLAIVSGEIHQTNKRDDALLEQQVFRMDQIIQHQLQRANRGAAALSAEPTPVLPILQRITSALQKLHRTKSINVSINVDAALNLKAREDDLMELFGNLIENGFKYAESAIVIDAKQSSDVEICIEDDGPGIPQQDLALILQRGVRADSQLPGQGIGLAVADDIMQSYHGTLNLSPSEYGGLKVALVFS